MYWFEKYLLSLTDKRADLGLIEWVLVHDTAGPEMMQHANILKKNEVTFSS